MERGSRENSRWPEVQNEEEGCNGFEGREELVYREERGEAMAVRTGRGRGRKMDAVGRGGERKRVREWVEGEKERGREGRERSEEEEEEEGEECAEEDRRGRDVAEGREDGIF